MSSIPYLYQHTGTQYTHIYVSMFIRAHARISSSALLSYFQSFLCCRFSYLCIFPLKRSLSSSDFCPQSRHILPACLHQPPATVRMPLSIPMQVLLDVSKHQILPGISVLDVGYICWCQCCIILLGRIEFIPG